MRATIKISFDDTTDIKGAFKEAKRIASILDVWCEFDYNGIKCLTSAYGNPEQGAEAYERQIGRDINMVAFA